MLIAEHTPRCHEMTRLISQSMEHPLPLRTRISMRLHYLICIWCERYRNQLRLLRAALHGSSKHGIEHMRGELRQETKQRMKNLLKAG